MAFNVEWDVSGNKYYETGCDRGMLYVKDSTTTSIPGMTGKSTAYSSGVAWSGLISVGKNPSGAEANDIWADNVKYASIRSAETFGATIEAYMYPDEFGQCDGSAGIGGVQIGQQARKTFGFSFRTDVGNDEDTTVDPNNDYKIHLIYGATAAPSSTSYNTINDSPDLVTFSWDVSTTPVTVGTIGSTNYMPTAILTIDTRKLTTSQKAKLEDFENIIYGVAADATANPAVAAVAPMLPMPKDVLEFFNVQ